VPAELVTFEVPLFNPGRLPGRFRFRASIYEVDEREEFPLQLKVTRGYARWNTS
jgi:hypothetical protein